MRRLRAAQLYQSKVGVKSLMSPRHRRKHHHLHLHLHLRRTTVRSRSHVSHLSLRLLVTNVFVRLSSWLMNPIARFGGSVDHTISSRVDRQILGQRLQHRHRVGPTADLAGGHPLLSDAQRPGAVKLGKCAVLALGCGDVPRRACALESETLSCQSVFDQSARPCRRHKSSRGLPAAGVQNRRLRVF